MALFKIVRIAIKIDVHFRCEISLKKAVMPIALLFSIFPEIIDSRFIFDSIKNMLNLIF